MTQTQMISTHFESYSSFKNGLMNGKCLLQMALKQASNNITSKSVSVSWDWALTWLKRQQYHIDIELPSTILSMDIQISELQIENILHIYARGTQLPYLVQKCLVLPLCFISCRDHRRFTWAALQVSISSSSFPISSASPTKVVSTSRTAYVITTTYFLA